MATPTSASAWKQSSRRPIELPSGNFAVLRNPGMPTFVKMGIIPNSLQPIIQRAISASDQKPSETPEFGELFRDPQKMSELFEMYDKITVFCFVDPQVHPVPELEERNEDKLYVDEVLMEDKVFIWSWAVGGTADLESFRGQLGSGVESLRRGENLASPTE